MLNIPGKISGITITIKNVLNKEKKSKEGGEIQCTEEKEQRGRGQIQCTEEKG